MNIAEAYSKITVDLTSSLGAKARGVGLRSFMSKADETEASKVKTKSKFFERQWCNASITSRDNTGTVKPCVTSVKTLPRALKC